MIKENKKELPTKKVHNAAQTQKKNPGGSKKTIF